MAKPFYRQLRNQLYLVMKNRGLSIIQLKYLKCNATTSMLFLNEFSLLCFSCSIVTVETDNECHFGEDTGNIPIDYDSVNVKCEAELIISDIDEDIDATSNCYSNVENFRMNVGDSKAPTNHADNSFSPESEQTYQISDTRLSTTPPSRPKIKRLGYVADVIDLSNISRGQVKQCAALCNEKVKSLTSTINGVPRQVRANRHRKITNALVKTNGLKFKRFRLLIGMEGDRSRIFKIGQCLHQKFPVEKYKNRLATVQVFVRNKSDCMLHSVARINE